MPSRKYPLDPLLNLRERQVDAATQKLAEAVFTREAAREKREAAEASRVRAEDSARALRDREREALENGELRAADLHRAQAWELGVSEEQKRLTHEVAVTTQGETHARAMERGAQQELAARQADAEVVEKDKTRFEAKQKQIELAKEEEAAADGHAAKHRDRWHPKR